MLGTLELPLTIIAWIVAGTGIVFGCALVLAIVKEILRSKRWT